MMTLQFVDKTLQIAVNQKVPGKQLQALHHILQQLGLSQFDVDVMNWHSYLKREKIILDMQNVRGCVPVEKAAVQAGVPLVSVTVTGMGERAGNASLEEVVLALHSLYGYETGIERAKMPL